MTDSIIKVIHIQIINKPTFTFKRFLRCYLLKFKQQKKAKHAILRCHAVYLKITLFFMELCSILS